MNTTLFLHDRTNIGRRTIGNYVPRFDEACRLKRKALERWENEGGRVADLALRSNRGDLARRDSRKSF